MRLTLLTLVLLATMNADAGVLLLFLGLLPAVGTLFFVCLLLAPLAKGRRKRPQSDNRAWRGVHRRTRRPSTPGRHSPARGQRLKGISRQAQLEEHTVAVDHTAVLGLDPRALRAKLKRPEGMPPVGRSGMWSWDGSTRLGPRPERPRTAPESPPPASGKGA